MYNFGPHVSIKAQGHLLSVQSIGLDMERFGGSRRGCVDGFTRSSRKRLLEKLASMKAPSKNGYRSQVSFLTLTTLEMYHPKLMKVFLANFFKRVARKFPSVSGIWRLEFQERGAVHFHVILYNAPYIDKLWIQSAWGEIVGQVKPFTRIELVKSYRHLMRYASKYLAKVGGDSGFNYGAYLTDDERLRIENVETVGRHWGVYNADALPWDEIEEGTVPLDGSWYLIRQYCRKFYSWLEPEEMTGFTIFTDDPYHALKHIRRLALTFGNCAQIT